MPIYSFATFFKREPPPSCEIYIMSQITFGQLYNFISLVYLIFKFSNIIFNTLILISTVTVFSYLFISEFFYTLKNKISNCHLVVFSLANALFLSFDLRSCQNEYRGKTSTKSNILFTFEQGNYLSMYSSLARPRLTLI